MLSKTPNLATDPLSTLLEIQVANDIVDDTIDRSEILTQVSSRKIEELHHMAYVYYQNKRFREASAIFRLLVTLRADDKGYWKGLGACLQMKKNYDDALVCYQNVQDLLQNEPDAYLYVHMADCHFAMKQLNEGFHFLDLAKKRAQKTKEKKIIHHVSFMHERWNRKKAVSSKP